MESFNPSSSQVDERNKGPSSFWTFCPLCFYIHEYMTKYENHDLVCQTCRRPFRALPMATTPPMIPGTESYYYWPFGYGGYPSSISTSTDINQNVGFPLRPFFSPLQATVNLFSASHMFAAHQRKPSPVTSQPCNTPISTSAKNGDSSHEPLAKSKLGTKSNRNDGVSNNKKNMWGIIGEPRVTRSKGTPLHNHGEDKKMVGLAQASPIQGNVARNARNLLEKKAKMQILKNLSEYPCMEEPSFFSKDTSATPPPSRTRKTINYKRDPKVQSSTRSEWRKGSKGLKKRTNIATDAKGKKSDRASVSNRHPQNESLEEILETCKDIVTMQEVEEQIDTSVTIDVPDSDFYNFDDDRTEERFEEGHIWAVYDEEDGMPHIYAQIQKVFSRVPFSVKLTWLRSVTGSKSSCGHFKTFTVTTTDVLNLFSHKMFCNISPSGGDIQIYPTKDDVWAVHDMNSAGDKEGASRYQIVQILHDFTEEHGVVVISLVKVFGFKSVYQRMQTDMETFSASWSMSMYDLHKFSHQIPARKVKEYVAYMPDDCWELDPAAVPGCDLKGLNE